MRVCRRTRECQEPGPTLHKVLPWPIKVKVSVHSTIEVCTAAMLHGRNNRLFFPVGKGFCLMQNTFIVPAMQYGCRAKPL